MDRDRSSRRGRGEDRHATHERSDDHHRRRRHDSDGHQHHHKRDAEDDHRRRRHDDGGVEEDRRRARRHRSHSPSESPPAAKRDRSSSRAPRDSVERRDSADREPPPPPSRKRKDHDSGGGRRDGDEPDREGGKRPRASVEPPPRKEERPRRERRRFEDVDAYGDERGKGDKGSSSREHKKVESGANGDSQSAAATNGGAQQPLNSAPAVAVPSANPVSSKVSSITTTNENGGVSIRSDEVTGKSSTDGTANSSAGRSSNLSLDALAKAKKALQLKKELSEKLKRLPALNKLGTTIPDTQTPKKETQSVSGSIASAVHAGASSELPASSVSAGISGLTNIPNLDAVKRAQELAAKMGFRQDPQFAPLINMFPGTSSELTVPQRPAKAPVLRLDAQGREIDENGNVISMTKPSNLSTLKVNINKQKKDAFQIIKPDLESLAKATVHFDERMGINPTKLLRPKRPGFQFIEEGKLSRQAELQRIKNQFGEAQAKELKVKQAQLAKAKVEVDMNPNLIEIAPGGRPPKQKQKEEIPDIEPWDSKILLSPTYEDISLEKLNMDKITIYVEHPEPLEPPAEPAPPPPQPLKLTKKEQKKLRTQRRLAKEKDRQEMIRQGLLEPPKPKVKMSNLMKVLGAEATQDPTRMEMEIRTAAAEREQAHVDRNIARKLTPSERREKKERKLFDDPNTLGCIVCVYRIRDLSHPQTRFKVDVNAQENRLTGAAVITDGISVVVVEGGKKSIKRYNKLMLNRIDWAAAVGGEDDADEEPDKPVNSCVLVWQGSVVKPTFPRFSVHQCRSEAAAKKVFADAKVPHYWDLAVNFSEDSS
ncbi:protein RDM16-like [Triticum dicoccoides]|uniref:protein RDM16-like n=1 Tax=Triticum dicoccoides TaxID=85692 RepID=UPI00188F4B29|nr:protein RDM16-like [Triticum dicoccoides]